MNRQDFMSLIGTADQQAIDQFFAIGDKNLDGSLSQDEFREVAKMLGYFDMINQFFPSMDANNDGLVTKAEMTAFTE